MITRPTAPRYTKRYRDPATCRRAADNHRWLRGFGPPLRLPQLLARQSHHLEFELIYGRHVVPADLEVLAAHLGRVHGAAYVKELHQARLDRPYISSAEHVIPDFVTSRIGAVGDRLRFGSVPGALLNPESAARLLLRRITRPVAFYKDTNPRNVLITPSGSVMVDFDDVTLAPFGYDLAKLVVTLAMTYGPVPPRAIGRALAAYNISVEQTAPCISGLCWKELIAWAEIHHILTSGYLGYGGYRYSWHRLRPARQPPTSGSCSSRDHGCEPLHLG